MPRSRQAEMRRAISRLQRLCCLGVGGQALMPALFSALRDIIPSSHQHFLWCDGNGNLTNYYLEGEFAWLVPLYLAEYYDRGEREVIDTLPDLMAASYPTHAGDLWERLLRVDRQVLLRSDYYGLLIGPAGMTQRIIVRLVDGNVPLGALILDRNDKEPPFSPADFALLDALHDFIVHGLSQGVDEIEFSDTEDRAIAVADDTGKLLYVSPGGQRLLAMAFVPRWTPETAERMRADRRPEIIQLCRSLAASLSGALPAVPPVLRQRNSWGEFVLRAYRLNSMPGVDEPPLAGIAIERREPRGLALLREIELLPLTDREKQLGLLLARGESEKNAARLMGVGEQTVITHRRNIYDKLNISNRAAFLGRLRVN